MEDIIGFDDQMSGFFSNLKKRFTPRIPNITVPRNSTSLFKKIATQSRQPQPLTLAQKNAIAKLRAKAATSKRKGIFRFF